MTTRKSVLSLLAFLVCSASLLLAQGTYTQIDYPGADSTLLYGINTAGDIVGQWQSATAGSHAFLLSGGVFTTLEDPNNSMVIARGINDAGQIVGILSTADGFLYDLHTKTVTVLQYAPFATVTPFAINNAGTIVGSIEEQGHGLTNIVGFELTGTTYKKMIAPGAEQTLATGINNLGEIVLQGTAHTKTKYYLLNDDKLQRFPDSFLQPWSINDNDSLAGIYWAARIIGFVKDGPANQPLRFPGSGINAAWGVNNAGVVVGGFYYGTQGNIHGFIWTPPVGVSKE